MVLLKERKNTILTISMYVQVATLMLQLVLYQFFGVQESIHTFILIVSAFFMVISAIIWVRFEIGLLCIICLFFGLFYLFSYLIFPENRSSANVYTFNFFAICLPCFINSILIDDVEKYIYALQIVSFIVFALGFLLMILLVTEGMGKNEYSMAYSFYMLLPALVFTFSFYLKKRVLFLILAIISMLLILMIGSRGALVSSLIFLIAIILIAKLNLALKVLTVLLTVFVFVFFNRIITWFSSVFSGMGVISRNLTLIQTDEWFSHDSGRSVIQNQVIELIKNKPLLGSGIGSEQRLLGTYSHNIFLDLFLHFGVLLGSIIIIVMVLLIIYIFIKSKQKVLFFMLFCYGFIPLLFSGSYLEFFPFWIFLGFCFSHIPIKFVVRRRQLSE